MARDRSPNYPAIPLETAIQLTRKLYKSDRQHPVDLIGAAKAMGSETLSGPTRTKFAALSQYGLIDKVAHGKIRVSDRGFVFELHGPDDSEYTRALREAALTPPLFKELYDDGYAKRAESSLTVHLRQGRHFSEEGAKKALRAFKDTITFAKLDDESYTGEQGDEDTEINETQRGNKKPPEGNREQSQRDSGKVYLIPSIDGTDIKVSFEKRPTPEVIDAMIGVLSAMKPLWAAPQRGKAKPEGESFRPLRELEEDGE